MIAIRIKNINSYIENIDYELANLLYDKLAYNYEEFVSSEVYTFTKRLFRKNKKSFPTGLLHLVEDILKEKKYKYELIDQRKKIEKTKSIEINKKLRDYQQKVVMQAVTKKRGIIKIATGGGKTVVAASIIGKLNCKTIFCVHTRDLFAQAYNELSNMLGIELGRIGGGIIDIKQINICMIQTLHSVIGKKYIPFDEYDKFTDDTDICQNKKDIMQMIKDVECIIVDEVHHLQSDSYVNLMKWAKSSYVKLGLSGTPFRNTGSDMLLEAYAGKQICNISASYLIKRGYLTKPYIYFVSLQNKYQYTRKRYHQIYKEFIVNNKERNDAIVHYAKQFYEKNRITLITVSQIQHGKILKKLLEEKEIQAKLIIGEIKAEKREELLKEVKEGKVRLIIGTSLADEGLDIPILDTLILAGAGKSNVRALQRIGRTLRLYENKEKAIIVDFYDRVKYLLGHSKSRLNIYEQEPEFVIKGNFLKHTKAKTL